MSDCVASTSGRGPYWCLTVWLVRQAGDHTGVCDCVWLVRQAGDHLGNRAQASDGGYNDT